MYVVFVIVILFGTIYVLNNGVRCFKGLQNFYLTDKLYEFFKGNLFLKPGVWK